MYKLATNGGPHNLKGIIHSPNHTFCTTFEQKSVIRDVSPSAWFSHGHTVKLNLVKEDMYVLETRKKCMCYAGYVS